MRFAKLFWIIQALNILDVITTLIAVYLLNLIELNPLITYLMETNILLFLVIKISLPLILLYMIGQHSFYANDESFLGIKSRFIHKNILVFVMVFYTVVVINNILNIVGEMI